MLIVEVVSQGLYAQRALTLFTSIRIDYMTNFPSQWMYQDIESCCQRYYSYDLIGCLSSEPSYVDPTENLFYPDWIGKTNTCIRDGQAPAYMKKSHTLWMYSKFGKAYYILIQRTSFVAHTNLSIPFVLLTPIFCSIIGRLLFSILFLER